MRRLSDYENWTARFMELFAKKTEFRCEPGLDRILVQHKKLIVAISHSSPLSWLPAPCLLTSHVCARGGGGRTPIAVMDRFFYSLPILKEIATYISQSERALNFDELVQHFESLEHGDLVVFPEGSNCFFGPPDQLQPFRSLKFVELAMVTRTALLLCVHRGSEGWSKTLSVPNNFVSKLEELKLPTAIERFLKDRAQQTGLLTVPLFPQPMEKFSMSCELYEIESTGELPSDADVRQERIREEAARIHERMSQMLAQLVP